MVLLKFNIRTLNNFCNCTCEYKSAKILYFRITHTNSSFLQRFQTTCSTSAKKKFRKRSKTIQGQHIMYLDCNSINLSENVYILTACISHRINFLMGLSAKRILVFKKCFLPHQDFSIRGNMGSSVEKVGVKTKLRFTVQ